MVRPALNESDHSVHLARRKLNQDLLGLPVLGEEVEHLRPTDWYWRYCRMIGVLALRSACQHWRFANEAFIADLLNKPGAG